jgi:hypothetical protein
VIEGLVGVFSISFILILFWVMMTNLDDPAKYLWRGHVSQRWLDPEKEDIG